MTPESALSATKKVGVVFCRPQLLTPAVMLSSLSPTGPPGCTREPSFAFLLRRIILRPHLGARANVG